MLENRVRHGVAATYVCEQLAGAGRPTAIDRSEKMIAAATARNAAHVAAGTAGGVEADSWFSDLVHAVESVVDYIEHHPILLAPLLPLLL